MEATFAQTEVFCYMEHLYRFVKRAVLRLFVDDEVNVDVCMDKVSVCRPPNMALIKKERQ